MDAFLHYFMGHLQQIIMWLIIAFFAISIIYFVFIAFFRRAGGASLGHQSEELESMLKKVLAQTEKIQGVATAGGEANPKNIGDVVVGSGAGAGGAMDSATRSELEKKQGEIEKLKNEVVALKAAPASVDNSAELLKKIKDLEARLSEYEIIEDDIADLSKYKDENAKLKAELEKLVKGDLAVAASAAAAVATAPVPDPAPTAPPAAEPVAAAPAPEPVVEVKPDGITDDLINEFEQAVNQQMEGKSGASASGESLAQEVGQEIEVEEPISPVVAPAAVEPAPAAAAPAPAVEAKDTAAAQDDILGEFVEAGVDTDKMMAEMAGLSEQSGDGSSALDQEVDIEKMAGEATSLEKG